MRRWLTLTLTLLGCLALSCGGGDEGEPEAEAPAEVCEDAFRLHEEELRNAMAMAPPCARDEDCVVMADHASCEGRVEINLCDLPVHQGVIEAYDTQAVARKICELAREAEFGCEISASCAMHGEPVCRDGQCVFAAP